MEDRTTYPDGLIGEPGAGFTGGWKTIILLAGYGVAAWVVTGIALVTAVRLIHWLIRG